MKILPFYTSTAMRDAERVSSQDALLCPVWKFLPWQIQRDHLADTYITEVKLVDCDDNETDVYDYFHGSQVLITDWENGPHPTFSYTTFNDSGGNILTAIESSSDNSFCYTVDDITLATGESITVEYNLTLNSGTLPNILLGGAFGTAFSSPIQMSAGTNFVYLTATGNSSGTVKVRVENEAGNNTSFACTFPAAARTSIDLKEFTNYDFLTYNGEPLNTTIPYGVYYLKVSDGNTDWFSEWFNVQNIQPQLITGWPSDSYDTFTVSGANITSAIQAGGGAFAFSSSFSIRTDEKFIFTYDLTLNSGATPEVRLNIGGAAASDTQPLTLGLGEVELTATLTTATAVIAILTSGATNYSLASVSLRRKSGEYVHLEFTNARDFNNTDKSIYYAGGWTQQAYLRSYLNLPSHETIEVGAEKNGEFDTEKLVSKYVYSVVSYESRAMHDAARLLPLHSTIKILDEVGVEHTPKAGNVEVGIDWNTFDTGSLRISWNEAGTVWTNSSDNIV